MPAVSKHYDLTVNGLSYTFEYKKFNKPVQKRFTDQIASDCCYSNEDLEKREIRLEFGLKI